MYVIVTRSEEDEAERVNRKMLSQIVAQFKCTISFCLFMVGRFRSLVLYELKVFPFFRAALK